MTLDDDIIRDRAAKYVDDPSEVASFVERIKERLSWRIEHGFKVCSSCGESKKPGEFRSNAARRDGLHNACRSCEKDNNAHKR